MGEYDITTNCLFLLFPKDFVELTIAAAENVELVDPTLKEVRFADAVAYATIRLDDGNPLNIVNKGIAQISHTTVHRMFVKYHLKTKTYHPKSKSNGIHYRRYRKRAPNELWHVDLAGPFQLHSQKVYVLVVVDDYSRFALAIVQ
jgi:hypothetical protein